MKTITQLREAADNYQPTEDDKLGVSLAIQLCDEIIKCAKSADLRWQSVTWPLWVTLMNLHAKDGLGLPRVHEAARLFYYYIDHPEAAPEWLCQSSPERLQ